MTSCSGSITRTSSLLTAIISLIIAVSIPAGYFVITYQYTGGSINAEGALSARAVEGLVINNPRTWQFEEIRLQEILERRLNHDNLEKRLIRDMQGQIVAQTSESLSNPMLTFSQPIFDSGKQVAQIEIKRSISPLIARTAIAGVCSAAAGIMIFLLFRSFPLRAVQKAYNALEESEQHLKLALTSGHFGVWNWDINKNVMIWDDRMYEIYGVLRDSVKVTAEAWQKTLHSEDHKRVLEDIRSGVLGERGYHTEFRIVRPDGTVRYIKADGIAIRNGDGKPSRIIGIHNDITEHKLSEGWIKNSLKEKELLLREVHHRIKNNMNVIMSLLSLQSGMLEDNPSAVDALQDSRNRVQSMMILYDKLYRSADFREISAKEYLTSLVDEIIANFPSKGLITTETRIDDYILDAKTLSPVGMILNELLSNAMKHAFNENEKGIIGVSLSFEDKHATLIIGDNGISIPESIDIATSTGFGLQLVGILTEQLEGIIRVERKGGTQFILEFDV